MPLGIDPAALPGAVANRLLEREAWARQRLAAHSGRVFVTVLGPIPTTLTIDETGKLSSASTSETAPDLTLRVSPFDLPALLADPTRWDRYVTAEGDLSLAATLKELAPTMPWLVEQAFADAMGAIVGQHVADIGRRLLAFPEYAAERVGDSIVGYAHERSGLLVTADESVSFADQVSSLAARADAVAVRIDALAARLPQNVVPAAFRRKPSRPR
jgi:ubiquinone biosynthesis protein UbiJ